MAVVEEWKEGKGRRKWRSVSHEWGLLKIICDILGGEMCTLSHDILARPFLKLKKKKHLGHIGN